MNGMNDINVENLNENEKDFLFKRNYWSEENITKRKEYLHKFDDSKKIKRGKSGSVTVEIFENDCYIPELDIVVKSWMDIASIFSKRETLESFLNFLIYYVVEEFENGKSMFYYLEKNSIYNFDYSFLLHTLDEWGADYLRVDPLKWRAFINRFSSSSNDKFNVPNYFLVQSIFRDIYGLLGTNFSAVGFYEKSKKYYNPVLVIEKKTDEVSFFRAVPFLSDALLKMCDRGAIIRLFEIRDSLSLKQLKFGKSAIFDKVENQFYMFIGGES